MFIKKNLNKSCVLNANCVLIGQVKLVRLEVNFSAIKVVFRWLQKTTQMFAELQMLSLSSMTVPVHDTDQIKTSISTTKNHSRIKNIVLSVVAFQDISITKPVKHA